jgi:hypothetical protein
MKSFFLRVGALVASLFLVLVTLFSVSSPTYADDATPAPVTATSSDQTTRDANESEEHDGPRKPSKFVEEHHEGFEVVQIALVGAAVFIALGLAYRAGKRRG